MKEAPKTNAVDSKGICGLCGQPGADKYAHPCRWPGEQVPNEKLVHTKCETEECKRAHASMTQEERDRFLRGIR